MALRNQLCIQAWPSALGQWVERAESGGPGEFEALQDDELECMLVQHCAELDFSLSPIVEDGKTEH